VCQRFQRFERPQPEVRHGRDISAPAALHDDAAARGKWLVWTLTDTDLEYPGRITARAHEADHQGGALLPGALVANTLDELRAMLPAVLTRRDRTSALPPGVIETWH